MKRYSCILENILQTLEDEIQKATEEKEEAHKEIFSSFGSYFGTLDERYYDKSEAAEERETVLHGKIEGLNYACELVKNYIKEERLIVSSEEEKEYTFTHQLSEIWYEDGEIVDKDTWEETHTYSGTDPLQALARLETYLIEEYSSKRKEWVLDLYVIDGPEEVLKNADAIRNQV